jgi:hypothetical protein
MAEKPLEYKRRDLTTKNLVQRINLFYFRKPNGLRDWKRRLMWILPAVAAAASIPFVLGIGGGEKVFSNGPVSQAHTIFEQNCSVCHTQTFSHVTDQACQSCHDGPAHVPGEMASSKGIVEPRCAQCHVEHEGATSMAAVADGRCTACHADLNRFGGGFQVKSLSINGFEGGAHPDFPDSSFRDVRPLKLNHAKHMPLEPRQIRDIKLPMRCSDCHVTDLNSPTGNLLPVRFDAHCQKCHERELEFDVYGALGESKPAPHTRDVAEIRAIILTTFEQLLERDPDVLARPIGRSLQPAGSREEWLIQVVADAERFLFDRKCVYCHEQGPPLDGYPTMQEVNPIVGRFDPATQTGLPWLENASFSHRAHRAVDCAGCHTQAAASESTGDVLIPHLSDCLPCHGNTGTTQDSCAQCHLYHDKKQELDRDRRPIEDLLGHFRRVVRAEEL